MSKPIGPIEDVVVEQVRAWLRRAQPRLQHGDESVDYAVMKISLHSPSWDDEDRQAVDVRFEEEFVVDDDCGYFSPKEGK